MQDVSVGTLCRDEGMSMLFKFSGMGTLRGCWHGHVM